MDRSLLDLSVHRGVEDEIIADVLHVDRLEVARRRDRVLEELADDLGLRGEDERARLPAVLQDLSDAGWREAPERRRRAPWLVAAAVALLAAAGVAAALLAGSGEGGGDSAPAAKEIALTPFGPGAEGSGTASLAGSRLRLEASGLPSLEEPYEVWLYNSVTDARRLARRVGGRFVVDVRLPSGASRYRFVDVSREPVDGNSNHSGASVLRVETARLRAASRP